MIRENKKISLLWLKITIVIMIMLLLPFILSDNWLSLAMEIIIFALAAAGLNLLLGDCGIVSFGHAGFFAVGGYTFGLLSYYEITSFWIAFIAGILAATLFAVIVGWFVIRLVEIYFALLCLAFSQIIWVIAHTWYSVTGGDEGVNGIPILSSLYPVGNCYYFVFTIAGLCFLLLYLIRESPFGRSLHALRDNRTRAASIGVNIKRHIYIAFIISGLFSGVAGILLVLLLHCTFPGYSSFIRSGELLFVCLLGGMYNFIGPIVGAFIFLFLNQIITRYTEYWPIILGFGIVLISLFFRGGVVGFVIQKISDFTIQGRK